MRSSRRRTSDVGVFVRDPDGQLVELLPIVVPGSPGRAHLKRAGQTVPALSNARASSGVWASSRIRSAGIGSSTSSASGAPAAAGIAAGNATGTSTGISPTGSARRSGIASTADSMAGDGPAAPVVEPPTPRRCQQLGMTFTELAGTRGAVAGLVEPHRLALRVERERRRRSCTASRSRTLSTHA